MNMRGGTPCSRGRHRPPLQWSGAATAAGDQAARVRRRPQRVQPHPHPPARSAKQPAEEGEAKGGRTTGDSGGDRGACGGRGHRRASGRGRRRASGRGRRRGASRRGRRRASGRARRRVSGLGRPRGGGRGRRRASGRGRRCHPRSTGLHPDGRACLQHSGLYLPAAGDLHIGQVQGGRGGHEDGP